MTWFLDLRAQPVGGEPAAEVTPWRNGAPAPITDLIAEARGRHVLFATHGFNVDRQQGTAALTGWATWLTLPLSTLVVGVLWPGDARWVPVLDYPLEDSVATKSGRLLGPYLDANFRAAASISFASHSLGARMVLETIAAMKGSVRRLNLMAGAIDDDCLTNQYAGLLDRIQEISILASARDAVLATAFPLGNPYWSAALGHDGPAVVPAGKIQGPWQIPDTWNYGHGDYLAPGAAPGGDPFMLPVDVPPQGSADPAHAPPWRPAWSAGLVSTRFR
jgi:hypothetical protein